jgi:hypothetical protein
MIAGVQIIGILFGLIMCYFTYVYYKRGNYSHKSLILWVIIWLGFITIVAIPSTVYDIMQVLKIQRTADFFVMAGMLLFMAITFYMYNIVKTNNKKMEELVRKIALNKKKK